MVVRLEPGRELDRVQVRAVVHLVASSIESLDPADVTVVDGAGRLLAPQGEESPGTLPPGGAPGHQERVEAELARRVESILEPVVGMGGVVARVSADMDWTESKVTEERYDPNSQVARSETRTDEFESIGADGGAPGFAANTGEGGGLDGGPAGSTRVSETFNYEISKTVSQSLTAMGTIKRLSVAVLVDSAQAVDGATKSEDETSEPIWSPESLQRFEQLAMQAVGYSEERGDRIVVSAAPFRAPEIQVEEGFVVDPEWMIFGSQAVRVLAQLLALVLFAQFVVKPFLKTVSATASETAAAGALGLPASVAALEGQLEGGEGSADFPIPDAPLTLAEKVSREAERRTEDSVTTIRNWLNQT